MKKIFLLIIILSSVMACRSPKKKFIYLSEDYGEFPYAIYEPNNKRNLAPRLQEISALTFRSDTSILCVNDEEGVVFDYNMFTGEITATYNFAKDGDYEGIELVNGVLYVLRSDGDIYEIKNFDTENRTVNRYKTKLKSSNDTEGLGYDKTTNSLLIACKGKPASKKKYKGLRAIYRFSLDTYELSKKPDYLINQEQIREILEFSDYENISTQLMEQVNPSEGDITFQPSAVAVHPLNQNLYVLASAGKLLVVLNPQGDILAIVKLKREIFNQPEGICFAPDGTLFISNEGKINSANILQFNYRL